MKHLIEFLWNITFQNSVCYDACRQKRHNSSSWNGETPGVTDPGFFVPFWHAGLCHKLVTGYLSPSNQ